MDKRVTSVRNYARIFRMRRCLDRGIQATKTDWPWSMLAVVDAGTWCEKAQLSELNRFAFGRFRGSF